MKKVKYFIDFDGTLFDRSRFVPDIFSIMKSYGFSDAEIEGSYKMVYSDGYDGIWAQLDYLHKNIRSFDKDKAGQELEDLLTKADGYLFSDTLPFLNQLDRNIFDVRLLTVGGREFQKLKVISCGIENKFDQCHYTTVSKAFALEELVGMDEKFILLDDKEREILSVREAFPKSIVIQAVPGCLLNCLNPLNEN